MVSISQIAFPGNKDIAFIQLSKPSQLFQDCWAEETERIIILGMRKSRRPEIGSAISRIAEKNVYIEEGCLGTNIGAKLKAIVVDEPHKIREFLGELEQSGTISKTEKDRAVHELGVRGQRIHPLISTEVEGMGAGI